MWPGSSLGVHLVWTFPVGAVPFGAFPLPAAVSRHRDRCPLAVGPVVHQTSESFPLGEGHCHPTGHRSSTSGRCSTDKSVSASGVSAYVTVRCSHGLWSHAMVGFPLRPSRSPAFLYRSASRRACGSVVPSPRRCRVASTCLAAEAAVPAGALRGHADLTAFTLDTASRAHGPDQVPASKEVPPAGRSPGGAALGCIDTTSSSLLQKAGPVRCLPPVCWSAAVQGLRRSSCPVESVAARARSPAA